MAGTVMILRPGFAEPNIGALMVIGSALFIAASAILVKVAARQDSPDMIAMYQVLYMLPMTFVPALFVWAWPGWRELALAAMVGVFSTLAQRAYTRAYAAADASAVTPFDFMRLPFAVALGFELALGAVAPKLLPASFLDIPAERLSKELAFGSALFLRHALGLAKKFGRQREGKDFGRSHDTLLDNTCYYSE